MSHIHLSLVFIPSCLKSLTILQPSIIVAAIMETIIFTIIACILLLSRDKNLLLENLALRQQLAIMKQKTKQEKRGQIYFLHSEHILNIDNIHSPMCKNPPFIHDPRR
jgi:hypothetical protein